MKIHLILLILFSLSIPGVIKAQGKSSPETGYDQRIKTYIDSMRVFDTHEHLFNPKLLKTADFLDFTLLLLENAKDDLMSAGMPVSFQKTLHSNSIKPSEKWKLIEPYWKKTFNTTYCRIFLIAIRDLYGINSLDSSSVELLSRKMKKVYYSDWVDHVLKDICKIDFVVQNGDSVSSKCNCIRHATFFNDWLTIRTKFRIDSLAMMQVEPIYTLEDFVKSMSRAFEADLKKNMVAVKINFAYERSLNIENVSTEAARKVFRTLINGNEDLEISLKDAKPLQDYMVHQLLKMAQKSGIPVAFHTGMQAGSGNIIQNSNPTLLTNLFMQYPDINFVLFHGSYPFGGELSTLAKTFRNVYIDMNWTYDISPGYARRYLSEWLETVPVSKIMAFGGDQRCVEITYGSLIVAKEIITNVLIEKVRDGSLSESEAINVARMILHDNGIKFYNIH